MGQKGREDIYSALWFLFQQLYGCVIHTVKFPYFKCTI